MTPELLHLIFLLCGLIVGGLSAWLIAKYRFAKAGLSPADIKRLYVAREVFEALEAHADGLREDLREKEIEMRQMERQIAVGEEKALAWESNFKKLQEQSATTFENIANRLLEEKSQKFSAHNQTQIEQLLKPLGTKIKEFEEGIERKFMEDAKEKLSLKLAIDQLKELNTQLSDDANRLVNALKGDNKAQGDWGEYQLEMLLKKAGLEKNVHYQCQFSAKDEEGKDKRPDFVVFLPEEKHLIIDSKVSLVAYERFFNTDDPAPKQKFLKSHVDSIRQHIRGLSEKNYQQLYDINSPDYLLLFVPLEPAFAVALKEDQHLFLDALDKNIVLVTNSTLLATLRTVSYIWKQEKQKRSVLEIARQSGLLYDRFVSFVDDLKTVGNRLDQAQVSYHGALQKLVAGKRYGDTLIGRAEKIRELGAKASKHLPQELLDQARDPYLPEEEE